MSQQNAMQPQAGGAQGNGQGAEVANRETGTNGANGANGVRSRGAASARDDATTLLPPVDVVEDAAGITVFADLPGVSKDRLDVRVEADTLSIEGELGLTMPEGMSASHAEVGVTRYRRSFTLSKELDAEKVDAQFEQGVLTVRIPKAPDAQPRRIAVRVH